MKRNNFGKTIIWILVLFLAFFGVSSFLNTSKDEETTDISSSNMLEEESSSEPKEQLLAPTISLAGPTVTEYIYIESKSGVSDVLWKIYVDGEYHSSTISNLPSTPGLSEGTYTITVVETKDGYADSEHSNALILEVGPTYDGPVISISEDILTIENFDIYPNGVIVTVNFLWGTELMSTLELTEKTHDLSQYKSTWYPTVYTVSAYATVDGTDFYGSGSVSWDSTIA